MFFSKAGEYEACGIFTIQHFILIAITLIAILIALKYTINTKETRKIIKKCTLFIWSLEIIIITFKIITGGLSNVNNYVPLYYCSLLLYAGILSSFGKGILKRTGDVVLATGGIVGGLIFIFFPTTSLPTYPIWHLVSIHSFVFHGIMLYLGILINLTNYIKLEKKDIIYYFSFMVILCGIALIANKIFDSNLMFISKNFPGTVIEIIYNFMGEFFTAFMILGQCIIPFYSIYWITNFFKNIKTIK